MVIASFIPSHFFNLQVIVNAANIAKYECQSYFQNSRWNCSVKRGSEILYGNLDDNGLFSSMFNLKMKICHKKKQSFSQETAKRPIWAPSMRPRWPGPSRGTAPRVNWPCAPVTTSSARSTASGPGAAAPRTLTTASNRPASLWTPRKIARPALGWWIYTTTRLLEE